MIMAMFLLLLLQLLYSTVLYVPAIHVHISSPNRLLTLSRTRLKLLLLSIADCQTQSLLANHQLYLILPPPVKETNRQTDRHIKSALLIRAEKEKTDHSVVIGRNENDDNNNNSGNQWTVVSFRTLWVNHHKGQNRGATNCDSSGNFKREGEGVSGGESSESGNTMVSQCHGRCGCCCQLAGASKHFTLLYFTFAGPSFLHFSPSLSLNHLSIHRDAAAAAAAAAMIGSY